MGVSGQLLIRLRELSSFPTPLSFEDLWALIVRSRIREGDDWLRSFLWEYRLLSWLVSLQSTRSCLCCGYGISPYEHPGKVYCSNACKLKGHRARKANKRTPFGEAIDAARARLAGLEFELHECKQAMHEDRLRGTVLPPDFSKLDNLPTLPQRCGRCSRGRADCHHTGHVCLFAGTASEYE